MSAAGWNRQAEIRRMQDRLDEIDLALTLAAERDEPLTMGEEEALRAERAAMQNTLYAIRRERAEAQ